MTTTIRNNSANTHRTQATAAHTAVALCLAAILLTILTACSPKDNTTSQFITIPEQGWAHGNPLYLHPDYPDSTRHYDVWLAIRYSHLYPYRNISIAADFITTGKAVTRRNILIDIPQAEQRNRVSGFGPVYQTTLPLLSDVSARHIPTIAIWQTMSDTDTLRHISDIGIIVQPRR